jgi:SAM-dependent methyltransferase
MGAAVPLVCPRCRAPLARAEDGFACRPCDAHYPIVAGVADCRVLPDPWISIPDDRAKARRLETLTATLDFRAAVQAYWDITPDTPDERKQRFTQAVLDGERLAAEWVATLPPDRDGAGPWLDLGCGTGNLLAAVAARGIDAVGLDVALRWLVVARRRAGLESGERLIGGDAAHLPFPDGAFATVTALGVMEHCDDLPAVLREVHRVLRPGGRFAARTVNRYSVLAEPHVGLRGIGYLPRPWANRYVRWRTGLGYVHHYPRSAPALATALRRAGFRTGRVLAARALGPDRDRLGPWSRRAVPVYEWARATPAVRGVVRTLAPLLDLEAQR